MNLRRQNENLDSPKLRELQSQLFNIFEEYNNPLKIKTQTNWYFVRWQIFDIMSDIELEKDRIRAEKYRKGLLTEEDLR